MLRGKRLSNHTARRNFRQRPGRRFGNKRHRSGRSRINLKHINIVITNGELHIDEANDVQLQRQCPGLLSQPVLNHIRKSGWWQRTRRISGMNTGLFNVFHDTADNHLFAVTQRIDVHFNRVIEETIQ